MGAIRQGKQRFSRNALKSSASVLGLAAGAVSWSGLAQAEEGERSLQTLLLPEHYQMLDGGTVVFALKTGEQLSLSEEQYVLLDGGLLLITDEIAQASMDSLPVMGSLRTQLLTEIGPVRSPDGSIVEVSSTQPLWSGEGPTPRLFEDVDLKTYEVAQSSVDDTNTVGDALATSMSIAPGAMALLGMLMTSDQPEAETPASPAPPSAPEFWTDDDVANSASTAITGSDGDSFVGYTAASTSATPDPLTAVGKGSGNTATFDMSAGGDNYAQLGSGLGQSSGNVSYIGANNIDVVKLSSDNVKYGASFTLQMGNGSNSLSAGSQVAYSGSTISYTGGESSDSINIGDKAFYNGGVLIAKMGGGTNELILGSTVAYSATIPVRYEGGDGSDAITIGDKAVYNGGDATFTMGNGTNSLTLGDNAVYNGGDITYVGGDDSDTVTIGGNSFYWGGGASGTFTMGNGSNSLTVGATAAFSGGVIDYDGGSGVDTLSFGDNLATGGTGTVEVDLGAGDTAADVVTFAGAVGTGSGSTVTIQKFNFNDDRIDVEAGIAATVGEITDAGGNLTWTDSGGNHKLIFAGIGTGGTGVTATSAELAAAII